MQRKKSPPRKIKLFRQQKATTKQALTRYPTSETPVISMPGGDFDDTLYQSLVDRCLSLEESHSKLREQFEELVQEEKMEDELATSTDSDMGYFPGCCFSGSPFKSILDSIGHAVHISKASSGEIIYWNLSAAKLFGWKDYEIVGETVAMILISEEYLAPFNKIIQRLTAGQPWSGQFPFKKRSGEIFMAMVTKSLLYEDGELLGVIMVSSDAALFNSINPYQTEIDQDVTNDEHRRWGFNFKRIQWQTRPPIAPVPHIASSASHLASKFLSRRHENDTCNEYAQAGDTATDAANIKEKHTLSEPEISCSSKHKKSTVREGSDMDGSTSPISQPSKIAAKILAKLQIGGPPISEKGYKNGRRNGSCNEENSEDRSKQGNHGSPNARISHHNNDLREVIEENADANNLCFAKITAKIPGNRTSHVYERNSSISSLKECRDHSDSANARNLLPKAGLLHDPKFDLEASNLEVGDEPRKQDTSQFPGSGDSSASHGSSSNKGDNDSNSVAECGIQWENLLLREEIGQGSFAVVYRGIWNGSDVAVKVYFGNEYSEGTLQDYEKEINIMKRLRHPNVLLFMGAVCSHERLAIVTEFLPRGSLFKTLHKNNQTIDIRRRLNMALDVARGMNYLHHRNPPIVHRDLKSSNLLVDRNWNVKVGDFGLSRLKDATFLTAKSGRGTPQWMAPEVLRNEPSNEKSDVFSFGVILWELMTQSIPWSNLNSLQVVGVVGFMDRRLELPERIDPQIKSLIFDCWKSDPEQRPSFQEILPRMTSLINRVAAVSIRRISHS